MFYFNREREVVVIERINKVGAEKEREMSGYSRRRFNINREDEWRARPP